MKIHRYNVSLRNRLTFLLLIAVSTWLSAQEKENRPVKEYSLTISKKSVNKSGKTTTGMAVNGSIPGPVLEFTEGDQAVIHVKNTLDVETSVHWHGILLPNYQDGVPYLTTPPIAPGTTFTYSFPLKQSGTYWYHSHTMLQEQSGVFGSFVIHPKKKTFEYDSELVLMLSDWTDEKPMNVLRNLKRGNEWYQIKKGTSTPLNSVISRGALGAQFNFWKQRMEGADIADVYYPAFLINGKTSQEYPQFKPGEKVRLRIINGSASSMFWMTFGGETPKMIAADGLNIEPVLKDKTFIGIAETYDYIVTIPQEGKMEFRIMAQDGSGTATAYLGSGEVVSAVKVSRPDKIAMMKKMAQMDMKMGAHALKFNPGKDERFQMKEEYGMKMNHAEGMNSKENTSSPSAMDHSKMHHSKMNHDNIAEKGMKDTKGHMDMKMDGMAMDMNDEYSYDYLKSPSKTAFAKDKPLREVLLNLTGNMNRYVWSMNGVPLDETDDISIKEGEVTRITFNNMTMMHHPMHLHGHFFRVLNKNGAYSPLKHTVNVPPMEETTIEFFGGTHGDWLLHCHVLYHMMSGMTRIFSYDTPRDERMAAYPKSKLVDETNRYYSWGLVDVASHMTELNWVASNIRNQFNVNAEYGWNKNLEAEFTYERYLHDYLRVFGGVNVENELEDSLGEISTTGVIGLRYLTPYLFNLDVRVDTKLRPQIQLSREVMIFPRTSLFGSFEYQADFGWVNDFANQINYKKEVVWNTGLEYFMSRNISLMGSYDNRFGAGGGMSIRF
ncbi:multicopper oxidase domain-containing protein [Zobellia roscoffensis]|uniref:multicopper oxidase domain-containing protein n=1 Tax=Zobellia roscoffensis TaxID=2779508 RepID=UPI00188C03FF|nr:multicopper oxidase domain-containing protein [Zobellia roscoffensis]